MNKILITGNRGFVGRAFSRLLPDEWEIYGIDIKDGCDCRDFFKSDDGNIIFDLVIHLAAIVGGRQMIEGNPIAVATDLSIDSEMFQWAVRTKQPRVVYFSSSAAYPIEYQTTSLHHPWYPEHRLKESDIDLNAIKNPDMSYGWAKLTGEILADYARKQGVNVHVFRPFSGYGEDQDLDYPFPSFIERTKAIIEGKLNRFAIWGDGNQVRDFIHIDDIVEGVMTAVDLDIQEPINLGSGRATSFNELAAICMGIAGVNVPIKHATDMPVGVQYRVSDNSKMLEFYQPKISLEEGIRRSLYGNKEPQ